MIGPGNESSNGSVLMFWVPISHYLNTPQNNVARALFLIVTTTTIILRYIMYSSQHHCLSALISFVSFRDSFISLAALSIPDAMIFKKQLPLYYLHQIWPPRAVPQSNVSHYFLQATDHQWIPFKFENRAVSFLSLSLWLLDLIGRDLSQADRRTVSSWTSSIFNSLTNKRKLGGKVPPYQVLFINAPRFCLLP
jgi:hypothetical protein